MLDVLSCTSVNRTVWKVLKSELCVETCVLPIVKNEKQVSETVGGFCCGTKGFKRGKASHNGNFCYSISTSNNSKALIVPAESICL